MKSVRQRALAYLVATVETEGDPERRIQAAEVILKTALLNETEGTPEPPEDVTAESSENRTPSLVEKCAELASSRLPDSERLQVLIYLTRELAEASETGTSPIRK